MAEGAQSPPEETGRGGGVTLTAALGVILVHLGLTFHFTPPSIFSTGTPLAGGDFDTHINQTWRVMEGLRGWGKSWVYDVHLLAGYPNGTIFDADNKGWELWTYALHSMGVDQGSAFSSFLLLAHLMVLPSCYLAARWFGLGRRWAVLAAGLGSCAWFFDSYVHWLWWCGTTAYVFASFFALLPLSAFYRYLQAPTPARALATALTLTLAHLIHPYSFFILAVPMAAMYLQGIRQRATRQHVVVALVALCPVLANGYWLLVAMDHWHYILNSAYFGAAGLPFLAADLSSLTLDTATTGIIGTRTGFRFLTLFASAMVLWVWRKQGDPRARPLGVALLSLFGLAYLGSYIPPLLQIQPYRFIAPATALGAVGAAALAEHANSLGLRRRLGNVGTAAVLLLAVPAGQQLTRDVLYYFPEALPEVPALLDGLPAKLTASGYPAHTSYRHWPDIPMMWDLARWVNRNARNQRVLVQNGALGEQLAWKTQAEIIGGFTLRNMAHSNANLYRRMLEGQLSEAQIRTHLETYAISWVITSFGDRSLERWPETFEHYGQVSGQGIYRPRIEVSLFEHGSGRVSAATNQIRVEESDPTETLVLRYHHHESLRCRPDCRVERSPNPVGGVDLIRIAAPHPKDFLIYNGY